MTSNIYFSSERKTRNIFFCQSSKQKRVIKVIVRLGRRQLPPDLVERLEEVGLEGEEGLDATEKAGQDGKAGTAYLLTKSKDSVGGFGFFLQFQQKNKFLLGNLSHKQHITLTTSSIPPKGKSLSSKNRNYLLN